MPIDATPVSGALIVSLSLSLILVVVCRVKLQRPSSHAVTDKATAHALRHIGGLTLWSGLSSGYLMCQEEQQLCGTVIAVGTPAFMVGLWEDLTQSANLFLRLSITMMGGLLGWSFTGYTLDHFHTPLIDGLLGHASVSLILSCLFIGAIANAIDSVDSCCGLAPGSALISSAAFFLLAWQAGDTELMMACAILGSSIVAILLIIWPLGILQLGNGGTYLAGTALGWLAVMFNARIPDISAWAMLLICAYPLQEMLFSMSRRKGRRLDSNGRDRLHLDHLVSRRIIKQFLPCSTEHTRSSTTSLLMLLASSIPAAWALMWPDNHPMLMAGFLMYTVGYRLIYARLVRFAWFARPHTKHRGHWRRT